MKCVELNPVDGFDAWDPVKLQELRNEPISDAVGTPLFENSTIKLWEIALEPNERLPFRKRTKSYTWTCLTNGLAITRNANGQIKLLRLKKGDTGYWEFQRNEIISDLENIGENSIKIVIVEYKRVLQKMHTLN
ncbi:hypothetical protein [Spongiimicrobium salis]|uniref:hypothetical protein n=1 Tax=Spongiimicrobium salis TaxID=1667022 RepID=UPI00374DE30F